MKKPFFYFLSFLAINVSAEDEIDPTATDYNSYLQDSLISKQWWDAISYAEVLTENFPSTPFALEAPFHSAFAFYQLGDLEKANDVLSEYMNQTTAKTHFEDAIQMKFQIAENFRNGKRKSLFNPDKKRPGWQRFFEWIPAKEDALNIYDEVITTVPHSEIAAKSLFGKALIQLEFEEYKSAIDTLTTLIRRFPKQEFAAESYLQVNRIYLEQCKNGGLDLNFLDLAALNLQKFKTAFPREERIAEAEKLYSETEELFAKNLFTIARFYERTHKILAAKLYYQKVIEKYPNAPAAEMARKKLVSKNFS